MALYKYVVLLFIDINDDKPIRPAVASRLEPIVAFGGHIRIYAYVPIRRNSVPLTNVPYNV